MKKLLAITVIFALVAGAAFAETAIGGSVEVNWMIAKSTGGNDPLTNMQINNAAVFLSGSNDDGTYGAMSKFVLMGRGQNGTRGWEAAPELLKWDRVFVWWQPIEQVKFFLGQDGDGLFNTAGLIRWGHFQMGRNISVENWEAGDYLLGNWDGLGMALMIYPIDGLEINFKLDLPHENYGNGTIGSGSGGAAEYGDVFKTMQLQAGYNVNDIGKFYLTYQGEASGDRIGLTYQGAEFIEGLQFELGFAFSLFSDATKYTGGGAEKKDPIRIGLGAHYTGGDWGVKTRFFIAPDKGKTDAADGIFYFKTDIMPWYALEFGTIYCNIRIETAKVAGDDVINWHVNPYLRMPMGGSGDFRVGALFDSSTASGAKVNWLLATSMVFSF